MPAWIWRKIIKMKKSRLTPLQIIVHLAGWLPLALLLFDFFSDNLTANPIQAIEQRTGLNAITFLLLSLGCTPAAALSGWKELTQRRKALGNYAFLYAALHVSTFFIVDYLDDAYQRFLKFHRYAENLPGNKAGFFVPTVIKSEVSADLFQFKLVVCVANIDYGSADGTIAGKACVT